MADYILNMGGYAGHTFNTVDVFKVTNKGVEHILDHDLTLSQSRDRLAAASCGDYILAMGGEVAGNTYYNTVDVFKATANGVEAVADHGLGLSRGRCNLAAATCGEYILAMGGDRGSTSYSDVVDVFQVTANGVEAITGHGLSLSVGRSRLAAAACGDYILAMGGIVGTTLYNSVDVFHVTENGVEAVADHGLSLSEARYDLAAASCGNYILAMGGQNAGSQYSDTVDVFHVTENGVEAVADHGLSLSQARYNLAAASAGNYILAMGGFFGSDTVDVFKVTENGVEAATGRSLSLSVGRFGLSAASAGNYVLAMGGYGGEYRNTVDVFQVK